jgi:glycosyltransferase involved in cell wall biosynthesis
MKRRLVILTEIIALYRIPVFNAVAEREEIDLHVIFFAENDSSLRNWRIYSDEIRFSYEVLPSWRQRLGKYNILVNRSVGSALRHARPDVILCGGYNYLASWQALRWAKRNHVQFLLWCESTSHDRRGRHSLVESFKQNFFGKCDGFVVPGKSAFNYVLQMSSEKTPVGGSPSRTTPGLSRRIFVAPNSVDIRLFSEAEKIARAAAGRLRGELGLPERYFLFVGRLVKAKGVLDLLNAYAGLRSELRAQVGLVFVGDGPLRAELESSTRCIFPGAAHFPGFVHRDELAAYYTLAECLVLPTHSDTWGMVVNEAMACGLPVICTDVAGCAADLVKANGRIVAPENAQQLAAAMLEISSDSHLRNRMSQESRNLIRRYCPQSCAEGIAEAAIRSFPVRNNNDRNDNNNDGVPYGDHPMVSAPQVGTD